MAEKKKYNSILVSGRKDETLTYSKYVKDEESGESVKESLDKKVNVTDELTTQQIKDGAITNEKMAADSVGNSNLQDGSVSNEKLEDGSITNEKLAENSITKDKLKDNTIGIEKLDPELRQTINAATGLPENLVETIQNVDDTLKDHQRQLDDKQSQIDDKQQQITANDEDISLLQTRSTQMEETIKSIAATGGASQATAVTYNNEKSKLTAVNIQSAVDEVVDKTAIKDEEGTVVETPFRYIQNEEFIFAKVDAEDKLLFGFQWDGTPVFGKTSAVEDRLQSQVNLLADKITTILGDDDTTSAIDTLKELKNFFASIDNTQTLTSILANLNSISTKLGEDIKNLKDTKVDKEEGKSLIEDEVKECFRIIENEEFLKAIVDAEDRVLLGFYRATGKPYYPLNEMYHVIQNEEYFAAWATTDDKVVLGLRKDGQIIGEIHAVNALKQVISQLQSDLISLQDKVGTIDTNLKELLDVFSLQDNEEYLDIEQDAEGKVLSATNPDGSHYIHNAKSETIPTEFGHIEDPEGRTEITTDTEDKILGYRNDEGERYEHKMKIDDLKVENLNLGNNAQKYVLDFINSQPKEVNIRKWHLPSYGAVNIKQETFFLTANDGYSDKTGIYPIVINEDTQENAKKGLTVLQFFVKSTLKDEGNGVYSKLDNSVGLDFYVPSKVTYVNEVPYVTSSLTKNEIDRTYSVNETSIKVTKITDSPTIGAWSVDKKTEHQCVVEIAFGHYLNGTYNIGVKYQGSSTLYNRKRNFRFTFYKDSSFSKKNKIKIGEMVRVSGFNLKANYTDNTRIKELLMNRIFMSIWEDRGKLHSYPWDTEESPFSGATGMIKGFPIRVNVGGNFYGIDIFGLKKDEKNYLLDGDASGMIVSGTRGNTNDPNNWTAAKPEDWEDEMNDELTESNKQALTDFFSFINSGNFTKESVPQRMSVIDWIDYFIGLQVFLMRDNTCRNMILYAKEDKKKLYPFFYDLDLSWFFYDNNYNLDIMTSSYAVDMSLWENFKSLYEDEIRNRYAYLRENILSIETIQAMYEDIAKDIPLVDIALEKEKWGQGNVNSMNTYISVLKKRLNWLDKEYFKI